MGIEVHLIFNGFKAKEAASTLNLIVLVNCGKLLQAPYIRGTIP